MLLIEVYSSVNHFRTFMMREQARGSADAPPPVYAPPQLRYGPSRNRVRSHDSRREDRHGESGGNTPPLGAGGARLHGGRVRRYRNEPALYVQRRRAGRQSLRTRLAGGGARHRFADLLVVDHRHLDQIRDPDHARRQSRRGRHFGAARAGQSAPRQTKPPARRHGRGRPDRGDAALRRRRHHSGDFGVERDRGGEDLCSPDWDASWSR